jgi:hypothetical protein
MARQSGWGVGNKCLIWPIAYHPHNLFITSKRALAEMHAGYVGFGEFAQPEPVAVNIGYHVSLRTACVSCYGVWGNKAPRLAVSRVGFTPRTGF